MRIKRKGNGMGITVKVSVDGNSLGFYVTPDELKLYGKMLKSEDVDYDCNDCCDLKDEGSSNGHYDQDEEKEKERIYRLMNCIKLTKTKAIKAYCQLIKKPNLFITLSFKTERYTTEDFDDKTRWNCMRNFVRNIHYVSPTSWFFPIVGFTKRQGLHFHIPSFIDYDDFYSFNDLENYVRIKWQDQLFKSDRRDCIDIRVFDKKHFSYLTSKKKNVEFLELRKKDENCRLYTRFYKKNMDIYKTVRFELSVEELDELQIQIERYFNSRGINTQSVSNQLEYWSGRISFIPRKFLLRYIKDMIKKRTDLMFPDEY